MLCLLLMKCLEYAFDLFRVNADTGVFDRYIQGSRGRCAIMPVCAIRHNFYDNANGADAR